MKNKQIVDAWDRIEIDDDADANMLRAILAQKGVLDKKRERRDTALLCFIQIGLFLMALSIAAFVLIISPTIAVYLLLGHMALGGFASVVILLAHARKYGERSQRF